MKKLLIVGALLLGQVSSCIVEASENPDQSEVVAEITERVKNKFDAHDPDTVIKKMAEKALKKCGIERDVIILQREAGSCSYTYSEPVVHPQEYLLVATKRSHDQFRTPSEIEGEVYHEIGHLAHGDISLRRKLQDARFVRFGTVASMLAGGWVFGYASNRSLFVRGGLAIGMLSSLLATNAFLLRYRDSIKEAKADEFMYRKLIEHDKLPNAIEEIGDFLCRHDSAIQKDLPRWLTGYPTNLERAKIGLNVLQDAGYNIAKLMENLPDETDEGTKQHLPEAVGKYFPELKQ